MSYFKRFIWKNDKTNKTYVNLPIGMIEYKDEYKHIVENFDSRCELYINLLYKIDKSYLIEMEEWNPESKLSMFNNWNIDCDTSSSSPNDKHMPLKTRRTIIYEFNKIMTRFMYCEYLLEQIKEEMNVKMYRRNIIIIILVLLLVLLQTVLFGVIYHHSGHYDYNESSLSICNYQFTLDNDNINNRYEKINYYLDKI